MSEFIPIKKVDEDLEFTPIAKIVKGEAQPLTLKEKAFKYAVRPALEFGGLTAGGIIGGGAGLATGPAAPVTSPAMAAIGGGLGYSIGKQAADIAEEYAGIKNPEPLIVRLASGGKDVGVGAAMEAGGQLISTIAGYAGKAAQQVLGRLTGTGTAAVEKALLGNKGFKDALRNKISGEDVVNEAREAINILKTNRSSAYQQDLAALGQAQGSIDLTGFKNQFKNVLKKYVRVDQNGNPDWTRSAIGPEKSEGVRKIKKIYETIESWGKTQGDDTVLGLDMLKRQMDDFWSESSNARAFVSTVRNDVKKLLVKNVPDYAKMTEKYAEATNIIKDIEQGLMLRKHGMTGRVTADMTLRRLTSSMKDNFELRRELVEILGNKSAIDLSDKIAGHAMSQFTPRGIAGTGPSLAGQAAIAYFISPKFWPVLIASSPRVSAEFLMVFGKAMKSTPGMGEAVSKIISYENLKNDRTIKK